MVEVIVVCALVVAALWFIQSAYNPLWEVWAQWPRTIAASDLCAKFDGLIRFGQAGAKISLTSTNRHDTVCFSKTSGPESGEFSLVVESDRPLEITPSASLALGESGRIERSNSEPGFLVSSLDPARLEALTREIVRNLGHSPNERYRVVFRGPADADAVNTYFGLK